MKNEKFQGRITWKSSKISIIPLRSDAITMYMRDKNAKHKTYEDEKSRRKKYVRTRNSKSIKEQAKWANPCAPYGCGQIGQKTKGIELEWKKEKDIHAKSIIIPILINSTHFHNLPHFWNFTSFKNPTFSFWSRETLNKKPICHAKKKFTVNIYSPRPSPPPPPLTSPPLLQKETDEQHGGEGFPPPSGKGEASTKRCDQSNTRRAETRRRRGRKGTRSEEKIKREGGGKGERA